MPDEEITYAYDIENRLTSVVKIFGGITTTVTFKYDPFGRRIEKAVDTTEGGVAVTRTYTYVYDNEDIVAEYLTEVIGYGAPTDTTTQYVHGPGIDEPLAIDRSGSVTIITPTDSALLLPLPTLRKRL